MTVSLCSAPAKPHINTASTFGSKEERTQQRAVKLVRQETFPCDERREAVGLGLVQPAEEVALRDPTGTPSTYRKVIKKTMIASSQ